MRQDQTLDNKHLIKKIFSRQSKVFYIGKVDQNNYKIIQKSAHLHAYSTGVVGCNQPGPAPIYPQLATA